MVDLSACQITAAGHWAGLNWRLFNLLLQPRLVLPLLAVLIAAPWAFRTWRWKRQASLVGVLLLLLYGLGFSPLAGKVGGKGLALLIPADNGRPADAIVILGRGTEFRPSRVQVAAELWQQQRAPLVFASGRGDAIEIGQMLEGAGVPAAATHWMKRGSTSWPMSGSARMMPASSRICAALRLNSACSPAKNFLFASRSCQRR